MPSGFVNQITVLVGGCILDFFLFYVEGLPNSEERFYSGWKGTHWYQIVPLFF